MSVAAVIVNYESGGALARCIESLRGEGLDELVVVDNGSIDGSARDVDSAELLTPGRNLGYGAAANRGVSATSADLILVCNPDLVVHPGMVATLSEALADHPDWGLVGPEILTSGGDRYPSARDFPSLIDAAGHAVFGIFAPENRFTKAYQHASEVASATTVDWVSGACQLVRRSAFEAIGGFDESYFMYAEDVDLCWRLGRSGWKTAYVPEAQVTHVQGVSTAKHPYRMILEHHRSLLRFAERSTTGPRRLLLPLVVAGLGLRASLAVAARTRSERL